MKPRIARNGPLWFQVVVPTQALRTIIYKQLRAQYPQLNYCVEWNDTRGYGIQLTITEYIRPGMYHCPPSPRCYDRPDLAKREHELMRKTAAQYGRGWRRAMVGPNPYPKGRPTYEA
jgi:hypothetical protein